MNTLILSKNGNEIGRTAANKKMLLVGRSPACDIVIRGAKIQPVHFLVEYVGAEMPSDGGGFWTAIDLTENLDKKSKKDKNSFSDGGTGEGIVITESKLEFRGFGFHLDRDELLETELKKGVLKRHLDNLSKQGNERHLDNVIEVVYFRKDIESVTNVMHLSPQQLKHHHSIFPTVPELQLLWTKESNKGELVGKVKPDTLEVFNRGQRITDDFVAKTSKSEFNAGDLIHIQSDRVDYYVRAVPNITVDYVRHGWMKDPIILSFIAVLIGCVGFAFYLKSLPAIKEVAPEPRVVNIETTAPVLVMTPTPTPVPATPTPTPTPMPKPSAAPVAEKKVVKPPAKKEEIKQVKAKVPQPKVEKPKAGLNTPAPVKNVNAVGLLGKFKNLGAPAVGTVSADQVLNQGIVSDTATGNTGFVVKQSAMGVIGEGRAGSINTKGLTAASTTLEGAEIGEADANGVMASPGTKDRFSSGSKIGRDGGKDTGSGLAPADGLQVQGGLDKEAIRKALAENKRAIRGCYEAALITKKVLEGKMLFKWVIAADGPVLTLGLVSSELGLPQFETCVGDVIKQIVFPKAPNNLQTTVIYPFVFQGKK